MSASDSVSSQLSGRHRRSARGRVRPIEYNRRAVLATEVATPGYAGVVGRVGVLAVALGVGSAVAWVPVAVADTTGSAGSTGWSRFADWDFRVGGVYRYI